jgi:8-oxo-dGTP pyrophosphatase MutT (NUDIX family)
MQTIPAIERILSAGIVVVNHDGDRYRFLVLRSFSAWDFPKALVEDGEDPFAVALRVTRETTGIEDLELNWGDEHRETVPDEDYSISRYYMAQSETMDVELRIPAGAGSEDDFELTWVTADEAEDVLPPRLGLVLDWAVRMLMSGAGAGQPSSTR